MRCSWGFSYREENGRVWCVLEVPGAKRESIQVNLNEDQYAAARSTVF